MVRADNNQQRAAKTVAAAIAVGKRHQARGEKRGWWRGRRQGGAAAAAGAAAVAAMAGGKKPEVRVEIGVSRTLLGDNLAHIKAMRLACAYLGLSQCLAFRQTFIRPKNVPWSWPRPSIGTTAKAKGSRRSAGAAALASVMTAMPPALRLDDGTILNRVARAQALLSPRGRRRQGGQGQQRQQRDPRQLQEWRRMQQRKRASRNGGQAAGLREACVPVRVGGGGGRTTQRQWMTTTTAALSRNGAEWGGRLLTRPRGQSTWLPIVTY